MGIVIEAMLAQLEHKCKKPDKKRVSISINIFFWGEIYSFGGKLFTKMDFLIKHQSLLNKYPVVVYLN